MKKLLMTALLSISTLVLSNFLDDLKKAAQQAASRVQGDTGVVGPVTSDAAKKTAMAVTKDISADLIQIPNPNITIPNSGDYVVKVFTGMFQFPGSINLAKLNEYTLALVPGDDAYKNNISDSGIKIITDVVNDLDSGNYTVEKVTGKVPPVPSNTPQFILAKVGDAAIILKGRKKVEIGGGVVADPSKEMPPVL